MKSITSDNIETLHPPNAKPVVLVVDDSNFSLSQVAKALGDNYEVICATGGAEGLAKLETTRVDLVITDLLMPHVSGLAFLGQTKVRYPRVKVIVSSADIQDATATKARTLGAAAFVPKPVNSEELQRVVRLVLAHREAPAELPFTPRHADAFREIFNIGIGRAASAMSKLVYETVKLSVPRLDILQLCQLPQVLSESLPDDLALVRQDFTGAASGSVYLLMSHRAGLKLINALVHDTLSNKADIDEADRMLLVEVGNILINALVGSIANTLGIEFAFGQATCNLGDANLIVGEARIKESDYVLFLETLFLLPGKHIGGNLVILLGSADMGAIVKGIDRLY